MKRNLFIKQSFLAIMSISIPGVLWSVEKKNILSFPKPANQVRHGLLEQELVGNEVINGVRVEMYRPFRMYANGFSASNNDLSSYMFNINNTAYTLHIENNQAYIASKNDAGHSLELGKTGNAKLISNHYFSVEQPSTLKNSTSYFYLKINDNIYLKIS